jgi:hypothetical protein
MQHLMRLPLVIPSFPQGQTLVLGGSSFCHEIKDWPARQQPSALGVVGSGAVLARGQGAWLLRQLASWFGRPASPLRRRRGVEDSP